MERVFRVLAEYREAIDAAGSPPARAVMTSAVRDAANGEAFAAEVAERFGLDARDDLRRRGGAPDVPRGDEHAPAGAAGAGRRHRRRLDRARDRRGRRAALPRVHPGGRRAPERAPSPSRPAGRPRAAGADRRRAPRAGRRRSRTTMTYVPETAIAVAGTATSLAAIDLELEPYDPARVEGHGLERATCEMLLARLAAMTLAERRAAARAAPRPGADDRRRRGPARRGAAPLSPAGGRGLRARPALRGRPDGAPPLKDGSRPQGTASEGGPDRTGRGTCHAGACLVAQAAGGADSMRLRPSL